MGVPLYGTIRNLTRQQTNYAVFFPIFSADEHRIIGYEVIGKFITENNEIDLKSFLADDSIPEEYRNKVDDILLEKALEHAIQMKDDVMIYINRNVDLLLNQDSEHLLNILKNMRIKELR